MDQRDHDAARTGEQTASERCRPRDDTARAPECQLHAVAADPLVELTAVDDADAQHASASLPHDLGSAERETPGRAAACPHDDHDADAERDRDRVTPRADSREEEQRRVVAGSHSPQRAGPEGDRDRGVTANAEAGARDEEPAGRRCPRCNRRPPFDAEREPGTRDTHVERRTPGVRHVDHRTRRGGHDETCGCRRQSNRRRHRNRSGDHLPITVNVTVPV